MVAPCGQVEIEPAAEQLAVNKFAVAASIAARDGRTMLFARTQLGVDRLVEQLAAVGVRAGGLHGGKTQRMRTRTLAEFREGRARSASGSNSLSDLRR